jgi:hypothetical protein
MAEIKTIEGAKDLIGLDVHFRIEDIPHENLKVLDILSGVITSIDSNWSYTRDGDVCKSWTANIDVTDPKDGGLYHLSSNKIYAEDTQDIEIINESVNAQIFKLESQITALNETLKKAEEINSGEIN